MYPYQPNAFMQNHYSNGITWVQGIEGAKAFQLAPSSNIVLMDSDNDGMFYIKTSDNIGMCNLRTFKYEEVHENKPKDIDMSQYVTKDELDKAIRSIQDERTLQATKQPKPNPTNNQPNSPRS